MGTNLSKLNVSALSEFDRELLSANDAVEILKKGKTIHRPIVECDHMGIRVNFDPSFQRPKNESTNRALSTLALNVETGAFTVSQKPGYIIFFSNRKLAHSREKFNPAFDGHDRWLLRSMIRS